MYNLNHPASSTATPGLMRRFAAILYDTLLLIALWLLATVPFVLILGETNRSAGLRLAFQVYLLAVAFGFLGGFWVHGGQTLGMRAWRLTLIADHPPLSWRKAAVRFCSALLSWACLGLGFLWATVDREHLAWHDRLSGTRLLLTAKPGAGSPDTLQHDERESKKNEGREGSPHERRDPVQEAEKPKAAIQHVKRKAEHHADE